MKNTTIRIQELNAQGRPSLMLEGTWKPKKLRLKCEVELHAWPAIDVRFAQLGKRGVMIATTREEFRAQIVWMVWKSSKYRDVVKLRVQFERVT